MFVFFLYVYHNSVGDRGRENASPVQSAACKLPFPGKSCHENNIVKQNGLQNRIKKLAIPIVEGRQDFLLDLIVNN